jgi:hypothetical protein
MLGEEACASVCGAGVRRGAEKHFIVFASESSVKMKEIAYDAAMK